MATQTQTGPIVNGIDTQAVHQLIETVAADAREGKTDFAVVTKWGGGTKTETQIKGYGIGGKWVDRRFKVKTDEPLELGGTNTEANPQEVLMAALNACMTVGYVVGAAVHGVKLTKLEIETRGSLDLRGFLGIDPKVKAGYDSLRYTVRIAGDGTPEQFRQIHQTVISTSPNRFNLANPIRLDAELVVE